MVTKPSSFAVPDAPFFRLPFDGLQSHYSTLSGLECGEGLTHQSFKDECDINIIIKRLDLSGFLHERGGRVPQFLDVSQVPDYHSALNQVIYAQSLFDDLPADLRTRFRNDPGEFVAFCSDPSNAVEAVSLGLAVPREPSPERAHHAGAGDGSPAPAPKSSKKPVSVASGGDNGGE